MDYSNPVVTNQLISMLTYQEALNDVFDPQWRVNRHAYLRAAVVEGSEMIEHHGFKWWKKQTKEQVQMQLELVDIAHFYLSEVARVANEHDAAVNNLITGWMVNDDSIFFDGKTYVIEELDALMRMELLVGLAVSRRVSWTLFRRLMVDSDITFTQLYRMYAAKNVLNLFRQHNGDKQGQYIKVWSGREDNLYLEDLMKTWKDEETMDQLYDRLKELYQEFATA